MLFRCHTLFQMLHTMQILHVVSAGFATLNVVGFPVLIRLSMNGVLKYSPRPHAAKEVHRADWCNLCAVRRADGQLCRFVVSIASHSLGWLPCSARELPCVPPP